MNDQVLYPRTELERTMKVQEVLMRAIAGKISWFQAAEILGSSVRSLRRWKANMEEYGVDGLIDRRRKLPSVRRVPLEEVKRVVRLYAVRFSHYNMGHFHQVARRDHAVKFSYTLRTSSKKKVREYQDLHDKHKQAITRRSSERLISSSQSVRTPSGALPSLGKRR